MFWAKIRKIMYTPVNPSFTIPKWDLRGSKLYGHVFVKLPTTHKKASSLHHELSEEAYKAEMAIIRVDPRYTCRIDNKSRSLKTRTVIMCYLMEQNARWSFAKELFYAKLEWRTFPRNVTKLWMKLPRRGHSHEPQPFQGTERSDDEQTMA